jgi:hypothetical protein
MVFVALSKTIINLTSICKMCVRRPVRRVQEQKRAPTMVTASICRLSKVRTGNICSLLNIGGTLGHILGPLLKCLSLGEKERGRASPKV